MLGLANPTVKEWMARHQVAGAVNGGWVGAHKLRRALGAQAGEMQTQGEGHLCLSAPTNRGAEKTQPGKAWLWGGGVAMGLSSCQTNTPAKWQRLGKLRLVKRSEVWVCATPQRNSVMLSWSLTASFFTLISAPHLPTTSLPRSMWLASWYHCFPT